MQPALQHHYARNRHHPEHFNEGIPAMTLVDLMEMLADWKASTERHTHGNLKRSLDIQKERFGICDHLASILWNTAEEIEWFDEDEEKEVIDLR